MRNKDFAIFILSHNRADRVTTYKTLKRTNYSGKIYLLIDDTDNEIEKYQKNFGIDNVFIFNKKESQKMFDIMDNFDDDRSVVFARNFIYKLVKGLGLKTFLVLDDDYSGFYYRYDSKLRFVSQRVHLLDEVLDTYLDFYNSVDDRVKSVAMSQSGDFIGGDNGFAFSITRLRKSMNSFFCSVDRPVEFVGRLNDDVNTYTSGARLGNIFLTIPFVSLNQATTQASKGGLTELYLNLGTYVKSFYTIMISPSSVTINLMGHTNKRLHHNVRGVNTYPMILREEHKGICQN